jgi:hypothetical protein
MSLTAFVQDQAGVAGNAVAQNYPIAAHGISHNPYSLKSQGH